MSDQWRSRVFTTQEAADLAGIRRAPLDVWVHRLPCQLFSEKRGGNRWFSPMDITVLRLAAQLELGGMLLLTAVASAFEHLQKPPQPRAILIVRNGAVATSETRVIDDNEIRRRHVDESVQLFPIGYFAQSTITACAALGESA